MIQLQTLNWILDTKDSSMLLMNNINEEFFSDYKEEYKFICDHLNEYGSIPDKLTFLDKFPNFDIVEVNESSDYLVDKLYDDRIKVQVTPQVTYSYRLRLYFGKDFECFRF